MYVPHNTQEAHVHIYSNSLVHVMLMVRAITPRGLLPSCSLALKVGRASHCPWIVPRAPLTQATSVFACTPAYHVSTHTASTLSNAWLWPPHPHPWEW